MAKFQSRMVVTAAYSKPVSIDLGAMLTTEMTITTAVGYPTEMPEVVAALPRLCDKAASLISHRFSFDDVIEALGVAGTLGLRQGDGRFRRGIGMNEPKLSALVTAGEGQTEAVAINDFIFMVKDISNAYLVTTAGWRPAGQYRFHGRCRAEQGLACAAAHRALCAGSS